MKKNISIILILSLCVMMFSNVMYSAKNSSLTLYVGQTKQLKVAKKYNSKIKWKSLNKKIVSVNNKGVVKAKKSGKTKVIAAKKDYKKVFIITVKNKKNALQNTNDVIVSTPNPVIAPTISSTQPTLRPLKTKMPTTSPIITEAPTLDPTIEPTQEPQRPIGYIYYTEYGGLIRQEANANDLKLTDKATRNHPELTSLEPESDHSVNIRYENINSHTITFVDPKYWLDVYEDIEPIGFGKEMIPTWEGNADKASFDLNNDNSDKAKAYCMWDEEYLYVLYDIKDEDIVSGELVSTVSDSWKLDQIELRLDEDASGEDLIPRNRDSIYMNVLPYNNIFVARDAEDGCEKCPFIGIASKKTDSGYMVEIIIKFSNRHKIGDIMCMNYGVIDGYSDEEGNGQRAGYISWNRGDPERYRKCFDVYDVQLVKGKVIGDNQGGNIPARPTSTPIPTPDITPAPPKEVNTFMMTSTT